MENVTLKLVTETIKEGNYPYLQEHLDLSTIFYGEESMTVDEFREKVYEYIGESVEIIYYATAMDFLKENDPSLKESLEKVHGMGYTADRINSELLATILLQEYCQDELSELVNELESMENEEESADE